MSARAGVVIDVPDEATGLRPVFTINCVATPGDVVLPAITARFATPPPPGVRMIVHKGLVSVVRWHRPSLGAAPALPGGLAIELTIPDAWWSHRMADHQAEAPRTIPVGAGTVTARFATRPATVIVNLRENDGSAAAGCTLTLQGNNAAVAMPEGAPGSYETAATTFANSMATPKVHVDASVGHVAFDSPPIIVDPFTSSTRLRFTLP